MEVVHVAPIDTLDELPPQGTVWTESGIDIAIAAGGDGLVGGVITHIAESSLPLGILPLGTANDIARSLHIPLDLLQATKVIAAGKEIAVDIAVARPAEQAPHLANPDQAGPVLEHVPVQKHGFFAHVLTIGLNVQFARLATNVAIRQRYGRLTYPFAALEVLQNHEALDVHLHFEGLAFPQAHRFVSQQAISGSIATAEEQLSLACRALQVTVINAPVFGGRWQLTVPGVSISDRLLDIVVIEDIDLGHLNTALARLFNLQDHSSAEPLNKPLNHKIRHPAELTGIPGIHHIQAQGLTLTTSGDPRDATLDGEVRGQTPMHVHMADERLRVLIPPK